MTPPLSICANPCFTLSVPTVADPFPLVVILNIILLVISITWMLEVAQVWVWDLHVEWRKENLAQHLRKNLEGDGWFGLLLGRRKIIKEDHFSLAFVRKVLSPPKLVRIADRCSELDLHHEPWVWLFQVFTIKRLRTQKAIYLWSRLWWCWMLKTKIVDFIARFLQCSDEFRCGVCVWFW